MFFWTIYAIIFADIIQYFLLILTFPVPSLVLNCTSALSSLSVLDLPPPLYPLILSLAEGIIQSPYPTPTKASIFDGGPASANAAVLCCTRMRCSCIITPAPTYLCWGLHVLLEFINSICCCEYQWTQRINPILIIINNLWHSE